MLTRLRFHIYCSTNPGALLLIAIAASCCIAAPLPRHTAWQSVSRQLSSPECVFEGNSDLYGLGIRIGIYLQWISGLLANCFHADSVRDMLATNTIFLIALFTALAIISTEDTVLAAEVTILLQFCFGFVFTVSSTWGWRVSARQLNSAKEFGNPVYFPLLGSAIRLCLTTSICAYNVWFWFVGLGKLSKAACDPVGFLFAPVDLLRHARVFFKITSVMILTFFGIATLSELVLLVCNWVFYSLIAAFIGALIASHRGLRSDPTEKKHREDTSIMENAETIPNADRNVVQERPKKLKGFLLVLMEYLAVVFGGIPWIMMNEDTDVAFTRFQSWVVILTICAFIILCLLIIFTLGAAVVEPFGSSLLDFFIWGITLLWSFSKKNSPRRRERDVTAQGDLQHSTIPTSSAAQHPKTKSSGNVEEEHFGILRETAAVEGHRRDTLNYMDAAQAVHSRADIHPGESSTHPEDLHADRNSIQVKEKGVAGRRDREGLDGERLIPDRSNRTQPLYSATSAATAPNGKQPRRDPNKAGRISDQALKFWEKMGRHNEDDTPQTFLWLDWALPLINLMCVVWSILAIELTIKWNNITEVHTIKSVGQLIPFVIGIVGFLKLLRDISVQKSQLWIYQVVLVRYIPINAWADSFSLTIFISRIL